MSPQAFFDPAEEHEIVEAIRQAELNTSGEIRVHVERKCADEPFDRAKVVFHDLGMDATELKNGVLFYLAVDDHKFVIMGDKGIDERVGHDFWDYTRDLMQDHFRHGRFKEGLIDGILRAGEKLKEFFPRSADDKNELPNEISNG